VAALLESRQLVPERMDDPALPSAEHDRALAGLARLNSLARSAAILWPHVRAELRRAAADGHVATVLDVATGSGDIPVTLARWASRERIPARWIGVDASAHALGRAAERSAAAGIALELHRAEATRPLPASADIVISSLFMHHLARAQAVDALRAMAGATRAVLLVSDLRRSVPGLALAWTAARALSRSPVVHFDAVASVRGAFTERELGEIAAEAGLHDATVRRAWPQRMLLRWTRRREAA
jgi:2-polyprenyl-3-methyl-5-hydroxy-6-metoxy-1,4-benzoquinol methylase